METPVVQKINNILSYMTNLIGRRGRQHLCDDELFMSVGNGDRRRDERPWEAVRAAVDDVMARRDIPLRV